MVKIPAHLRKRVGDSRLSVCSTNDSIQESNLRRAGSAVANAGVPIAESFGVRLCIIVTFVPPCLYVIWDTQHAAVLELDGNDKVLHDLWDDG